MTVQELIDQLEKIKGWKESAKDYDVRILGFNVSGARAMRIKIDNNKDDVFVEITTCLGSPNYG